MEDNAPSEKTLDEHLEEKKKTKPRRTFVAADGKTYPVGPCGYIPDSALRRRTFHEKIHPERGPYTKGRKRRRKKYGGVK